VFESKLKDNVNQVLIIVKSQVIVKSRNALEFLWSVSAIEGNSSLNSAESL
jgi:hypothetical protein